MCEIAYIWTKRPWFSMCLLKYKIWQALAQRSRFSTWKQWAIFKINCVQFAQKTGHFSRSETSNIVTGPIRMILPLRPGTNKVSVHYGNFQVWLSRRDFKNVWHWREIGNICPYVPNCPWQERFLEHLLNCANRVELAWQLWGFGRYSWILCCGYCTHVYDGS